MPRTFRSILLGSGLRYGFVFLVIAAYTVPSRLLGLPHSQLQNDPGVTSAGDSFAGVMAEQNDCWRMHDKHPDIVPGHAIVERDPRRGPRMVDSKIGFDIWLRGAPGTLYAFCP